ncbi:hypothetical protein I917_13765 [Mycobacterium tuberculosis str. Haarlem/NITR202]|uniref:Uncharacterized protein n=1 Tax=Mycobacterium tuberculosis str. Haarlem/NITR202 TaxID=1304279 RepID=R4M6K8_MYCTX|nr:hypothetical protein I917_13765 [Mycobacterium tuberculosis str. Haarlem/NITR202]
MDNSAFSTDRARVWGVSATGSQVVHTADGRREPFTDQAAEQVRPIAYSQPVAVLQVQLAYLLVALGEVLLQHVADRQGTRQRRRR